jgi:PAT family beta-lactamase induction signal transducer AmpG
MKSKTLFTWFLHFALGISSGLPLLLTGSTLQAWMTDQHVDLKAIGLFALVGIPYSLKFLWAPFMDRYRLPFLTKRRGWMILTQIFLALFWD